ncbi:MAG: hypothetical protein ACREEE_13035 [Dongiaceae bacterium]
MFDRAPFVGQFSERRLAFIELMAEPPPGDYAAVALSRMISEVTEQAGTENRRHDVPYPLPLFLSCHHDWSESQVIQRRQQKSDETESENLF